MNPYYHAARYLKNAHKLSQLPPDEGFEVAFAGRSNAGKSTAVNAITRQRGLARISKTPGRTQQLVLFELDADHRLVDLPGYGYAKVPVHVRAHWEKTVSAYLERRQCLRGLMLIMDIRHPLKPGDEQILTWVSAAQLPCHVLLSKADKLSRGKAAAAQQGVRNALADLPGISVQTFSGKSGAGVEQAHAKLDEWMGFAEDPG